MKRLVDEKAKLMSKFPKDPIVRGSFFNHNKKYAKLRGKKRREFKPKILDRIENLETDNPKDGLWLINWVMNTLINQRVVLMEKLGTNIFLN